MELPHRLLAGIDLDLSWLTPSLAMGGRIPNDRVRYLAEVHAIRRVVDLRGEESDDEAELQRHGLRFLHLPTPDLHACTLESLTMGVRWVREGLSKGERVYIHCQHGIGRSSLLALCVLVAEGRTPREALEHAKSIRWKVSPSPQQLRAFLEWTAGWYCSRGEPLPPVTWGDLATIAYRHLREPSTS